jgi:hypothetical protein
VPPEQADAAPAGAPLMEASWEEFQQAGLLWWVNRILHIFGWAIVVVTSSDGTIMRVYPARTAFRGFSGEIEGAGHQRLTEYMAANVSQLLQVFAVDKKAAG